MNQFYLHIERFTQNRYSGDPETAVEPDKIDSEKNLHVYLTGSIPPERSVQLRPARIATVASGTTTKGEQQSAVTQQYKASLSHYTLASGSKYLLKAIDDDQNPTAIASHEIVTI